MDQLKRANFHGGLQHPDSRVLGQLAHAETGAKGAHAAVLGLHDKGTLLRILGGLNQDFTLVQTNHALFGVEVDIQRRVGVQLQL